jgi:hypothetical protein
MEVFFACGGAHEKAARMGIVRKYTFVLILALAVVYVYAPLTINEAGKLGLDEINRLLLSAKSEVVAFQVNSIAATNVMEHLDYRLAQRMKSLEESRSLPAAHPDNPQVEAARAQVHKPAARTGDGGPSEASAPTPAFSGPEALVSDQVCQRDQDRLDGLSNSRSSDEAMRFLSELRCEKLRPQLFRFSEKMDFEDPVETAARPLEMQSARSAVSTRSLWARRHAKRRAAPNLPSILLALLGEEPTAMSSFRGFRAAGGRRGGRWRGS